jgi:hypothetical protein
MAFKKNKFLNKLYKLYLRLTNKQKFIVYKEKEKETLFFNDLVSLGEQITYGYNCQTNGYICSFKHSGNCGDIIYSIPTIMAIAKKNNNDKINLYLNINKEVYYGPNINHPLGNVMLNEKMVNMLQPLLFFQNIINTCEIYNNQPIDYDLDKIREYPMLLDRGNIARYYFHIYAVNYDLSRQWLFVKPSDITKNSIVISRSNRYRMPYIDYSFLNDYQNIKFVGLHDEFLDMKKHVPNIKYLESENFYDLASFISGSRLFIGNQSFPFALAEALKVNRLLEVYYKYPNVIVSGENGYDFCYQKQFEYLVKTRYEAANVATLLNSRGEVGCSF